MGDAPHLTPPRRAEHAARDKRLAEALRENLRRRKEQMRAREDAPARDDTETVMESRGVERRPALQ